MLPQKFSFNRHQCCVTFCFPFCCSSKTLLIRGNSLGSTKSTQLRVALTALVLAALWRAGKKYGAARSRIAYRLIDQKRSRYEQSTLLIKDFKYGSSLSVLVGKNKEAQRSQVGQFFTLTNNTTAEFDSGSKFKE